MDYNIIIIGSGVAGAICAAKLAGDGRKILVLEAAKNGLGVIQREQYRRVWDTATGKAVVAFPFDAPHSLPEGHWYQKRSQPGAVGSRQVGLFRPTWRRDFADDL